MQGAQTRVLGDELPLMMRAQGTMYREESSVCAGVDRVKEEDRKRHVACLKTINIGR